MPVRTATKDRKGTKSSNELPKELRSYIEKYSERLSSSTRRAKWIVSPDDEPDRNGQTLVTRNHEVIKHWAEERGARPTTVDDTGKGATRGRPRVLRFDFPGYGGDGLRQIDWQDWFKTFDDRNLAFVYQERLKNGNQSNFFKLDSPEREDG